MAFPTSSTFVAAATLTAAQLNAVRADLNAINGYVAKTADQSVTSSAVLVNDTHLFATIAALGTYVFDLCLFAVSAANAAGDLGVSFTYPTGTLNVGWLGQADTLASSDVGSLKSQANLGAASGTLMSVFGLSTSPTMIRASGTLVATATGTLRLQWAQEFSNVSATTLKAGSFMTVKQVA